MNLKQFHRNETIYIFIKYIYRYVKMGYVYLFTVGFEEKYIIRSLVDRGLRDIDLIILVSNVNPPEKTLKAIDMVRLTMKNLGYPQPMVHYIDISNVYKAIGTMKQLLKEKCVNRKLIINISGGMKILSYIIISSVIQLDLKSEVEVLREDMEVRYVFPIEVFKGYDIDFTDITILNIVNRLQNPRITDIAIKSGLSKATVSRRIVKLEELGLVKKENGIIKLMEPAYMYISA